MFIHNLKYSLKVLIKNKMLIFWTFAFPIILGTFFNMAFSNIENSEKFNIIDIAIVDELIIEENSFNGKKIIYNTIFDEIFKILSDESNKDRLFNIKYVNGEEAKRLLDNNEIIGYVVKDEFSKVVVKQNGINETILKQVNDEINESVTIIETIASNEIKKQESIHDIDYIKIYKDSIYKYEKLILNEINIKDISSNNLSYTMIEFYTLIAMTCLYGGILGMVSVNQNLANMSNNGKRVSISPTSKSKLILSSVIASYIVQLVGLALLFIYTIFILKVDYGNNLPLIILLALTGSLAGLTLGIAVACLFKTNDNVKTGIIISITMLGCFLSGMMGITMKYVIDKNIPIINKINPASMITDGFYSLYYYDTNTRFYFNIISLLIFASIMIIISLFSLRRQKYDSI